MLPDSFDIYYKLQHGRPMSVHTLTTGLTAQCSVCSLITLAVAADALSPVGANCPEAAPLQAMLLLLLMLHWLWC